MVRSDNNLVTFGTVTPTDIGEKMTRQIDNTEPHYVYADIEADGFKGNRILQLSAITQDGFKFDIYVDPEGPIPLSITNLLGLYYYNKHLYRNGRFLFTYKIKVALHYFADWITQIRKPVTLVFHNGFSFDCDVLIKHLLEFDIKIPDNLVSFADTLPFFRRTLKAPDITSHTLSSLAKFYKLPKPSHNALTDSIALKNICERFASSTDQNIDVIFKNCTRNITDYTNKHINQTPIPKLKKVK